MVAKGISGSREPVADRERNRGGSGPHVELGEDVIDMVGHGALAQVERIRDLLIRLSFREQDQHLVLAGGQVDGQLGGSGRVGRRVMRVAAEEIRDRQLRLVGSHVPPELEFVKAGGATEGKAEGATVRFAPVASLAPKAKATFLLTAKGVKAGDSRFRIEMKSDQVTTPVMETESTHVY